MKQPSTEAPAAGEIVAYLQATAPRLATALTRERLGFLKVIARNRRLLEAGERLQRAARLALANWHAGADAELADAAAAYQEAAKS